MSPDEEDEESLLGLATAVADGAADWERRQLEASSEEDKRLIAELRVLFELRKLHASSPESRRWGHLEILGLLGVGGFGEVLRARDRGLDREVALKLVRPAAGRSVSASLEEARLLARVRHPNVVTVHGADFLDGRVGIWMELVRGRTLAELVRQEGPLGPREAALIGLDLCRALAAVHGAGLLHRDIKAANVMREEGGRILLMDFGAGWDLATTAATPSRGTPLYLAPETLRGEPPSRAADLYALGVLLYFLVSDSHPVESATLEGLRDAHRRGRRVRLRDRRPDLPLAFVRIVERALDSAPERRFAGAGEFEAALSDWFAEAGRRPARNLRRPGVAIAVAAGVTALLWALWPAAEIPRTLGKEASLREAMGAYEEARSLYERLVAIQEKRFGPDDVEVAHALVRLARVVEALGSRAEAVALYERALAIYEKHLSAGHPSIQSTRVELGSPVTERAAVGRASRGDPFVRPLATSPVDDLGSDVASETPLYTIEASLEPEQEGRPVRLRLNASEPLFVYVLTEEPPGRFSLLFPLPGVEPSNPVPAGGPRHLPAARKPLVIMACPARLADLESELRTLRVPGAGERVFEVPLSANSVGRLRKAFGIDRLFASARPLSQHLEIVRGLWIRRAGGR